MEEGICENTVLNEDTVNNVKEKIGREKNIVIVIIIIVILISILIASIIIYMQNMENSDVAVLDEMEKEMNIANEMINSGNVNNGIENSNNNKGETNSINRKYAGWPRRKQRCKQKCK